MHDQPPPSTVRHIWPLGRVTRSAVIVGVGALSLAAACGGPDEPAPRAAPVASSTAPEPAGTLGAALAPNAALAPPGARELARAGEPAHAAEPKLAADNAPAKVATPRVPMVQTTGRTEGPVPWLVVEAPNLPPSAPIVVAMHGRGDNPEGFARLARRLALPVRVIVAQGPLPFATKGGRYQWFDSRADGPGAVVGALPTLKALVETVRQTYPDAPRPWALGFSQGAMLGMAAAVHEPELFEGVIALSGFLAQAPPPPAGDAPQRRAVPVFASAGDGDRIIPKEKTEAAVEALEALGCDVTVRPFIGKHTVPKPVLEAVRDWLWARAGAEGGTKPATL